MYLHGGRRETTWLVQNDDDSVKKLSERWLGGGGAAVSASSFVLVRHDFVQIETRAKRRLWHREISAYAF